MLKPVVLDASALIALIAEEKGSSQVEPYLPYALISAVNLAEVASYLIRRGIALSEANELLKDLALRVTDYDEEQAFICASLIPETTAKGLSLGDRSCLALGIARKLPVLTADKAWKSLHVDIKIELIR